MGRKRSRRKNPRARRTAGYQPYDDPVAQGPSDPLLFAPQTPPSRMLAEDAPATAAATCDSCCEFVLDGEAGRGTCLHPASGVLSPWIDTPACPFYEPQRRSRRAGDRNIW